MITVEQVMTANPVSLSQYNSLHDARQLMNERRFRHIPIVDESNNLIGLISHSNVLANGVSSQDYANSDELAKIEQGTLLADIMTKNVTTITSSLSIVDAAQIIYRKKFGCLPVVDTDNKLVGIITDHDFVGFTLQLLDMMEQSES